MSEQKTTVGSAKLHLTFLSMIGIVVVIVGIGIVTIPGAPMRGSGIGTIAVLLGLLLVGVDYRRSRQKSP